MPHDSLAIADPGISAPVEARHSSRRWILISTVIGSVIEWYDFYIYGTAAALVFGKLFFPASDPAVATLASFLTFAVGLFARPFGGIVFGHFGDKIGRKSMLMLSLFLMGAPTVLIGLLPTYQSVGFWAPALLVILRVVQGFALGGEWGGAVLMAVEHAPSNRRSLFGSLPQIGVPGGVLLSIGAFALVSRMPESDFLAWGWRIPFLASFILVAFGLAVRWRLRESPEFEQSRREGRIARLPIAVLLKTRWRSVLLAAGAKFGEVTLFFLVTVYLVSYATAKLGFARSDVLNMILAGSILALMGMPIAGALADRFGPRRLYVSGSIALAIAAIPMFWLIETREAALVAVALIVPFGLIFPLIFGPQPSLYAAQFPPEVRYSGVSLGVSLASAIGGGLAPVIATGLVAAYGDARPIGYYLAAAALISALSAFLMRPAHSAQS
jgi:metabolite-proton symporter